MKEKSVTDGAGADEPVRGDGGRFRDDGGFAMLTVILLIMVCAAVSVLMLGVVVSQVKPTVFEAKNTRTIAAAEAGIDATLSQLRTATRTDLAGNVFGNPHQLPCTVSGTVAGASTAQYDVQISYFVANPAGKDATWRSANQIVCTPGNGTSYAPSFAVITASGNDAAVAGYATSVGDRTLETVYTFQVVNANVSGGIMWDWGRTDCLHAVSAAATSSVTYVAAASCTDDALNLWSYNPDYTIRLASTDFAGSTSPLCLTGYNIAATLQLCSATRTDQKFAWYDGARFFVLDPTGTTTQTTPSYCISANSSIADPVGKSVWVGSCGYNVAWSSFDPDPRVGAGKASVKTHQIVSFLQFGRCFDDTDTDVGKKYMILYPCKQAPGSGESVLWNQQWWYSEPVSPATSTSLPGQHINVYYKATQATGTSSNTYCLKSPLTDGGWVTLVLCSKGGPGLNWVRVANTGTYSTSWLLKDSNGLCATVGPKVTDDTNLAAWSTITVATCTGGPEQKWNAPKNAQSSTLDNFKELN